MDLLAILGANNDDNLRIVSRLCRGSLRGPQLTVLLYKFAEPNEFRVVRDEEERRIVDFFRMKAMRKSKKGRRLVCKLDRPANR